MERKQSPRLTKGISSVEFESQRGQWYKACGGLPTEKAF